ncbi:hypothetical protein FKM82_023635 [Ascaphus truei]
MDRNDLIQSNNDLTESSRRRRLSSILKAPRSPLRDLGSGNELHQDSCLVKRRKSSRRVSFAETIRVFTPELQAAGAETADTEGHGAARKSENDNEEAANTRGQIAGMETLLHAPIQAPIQQSEWNYVDYAKNHTVLFSGDNDMDMTTSNTVSIAGFLEEKPQKIDITSLLSSFSSQGKDKTKNMDLTFSTSAPKTLCFESIAESSGQKKINFGDFLDNLKSTKASTSYVEGIDKENLFLDFVPSGISKENAIPNSGKMYVFHHTQEDTGNVTRIFREQDDGLDLTKCHTTNITSFIPMSNKEFPNSFPPLGTSGENADKWRNQELRNLTLQQTDLPIKDSEIIFKDQTVFLEDMDITRSHTVHIDGSKRQNILNDVDSRAKMPVSNERNVFPFERTVLFTDSNDMEFTKNHTVALNSNIGAGVHESVQRKKQEISMKHAAVSPEEDMDLTKSHTVALDRQSMEQLKCNTTAPSCSSRKKENSWSHLANGIQNHGRSLPVQLADTKTIAFSEEDIDLNSSQIGPGTNSASKFRPCMPRHDDAFPHFSVTNEKMILPDQDMDLTQCGTALLNIAPHTGGLASNDTDSHTKSEQVKLQDSEEIAKSHNYLLNTTAKISKLSEPSRKSLSVTHSDLSLPKSIFSSGLSHNYRNKMDCEQYTMFPVAENDIDGTKYENMVSPRVSKEYLPIASAERTVVFSCDHDDMEFTKSHTIAIDDNILKETNIPSMSKYCQKDKRTQISGLRLSSVSNKSVLLPTDNEMELTKSHTRVINGTPWLNDREHCTTPSDPPEKTAVFTSGLDDMDITKSHTVGIDHKRMEEALGRSTVNSFSNNKRKSVAGLRMSCIPPDKTVQLQDDMELTDVGINGLHAETAVQDVENRTITSVIPKEKTVLFSYDQDDMDMTRSHTFAIDGKVMCEGIQNNQHTHLTARRTSGLDFSSDTNKTTGFTGLEYDMERTKSHTMVINGKEFQAGLHNQSVPGVSINRSTTLTSRDQDDMDHTKSHTVSIDNKITEETLSGGVLKSFSNTKRKSVHGLRKSFIPPVNSIEERKINADEVISFLEQNPIVSRTSQDKTVLFPCDVDDMDMTKSHTVAIENKLMCEEPKTSQRPQRYNANIGFQFSSVPGETLFEDDLELGKIVPDSTSSVGLHDKSDSAAAFYKSGLLAGYRQDNMDFTKSHTVSIDNQLMNGMCKEGLNTVNVTKRESFSGSCIPCDKTDFIVDEMEMTQTHANVCTLFGKTIAPAREKRTSLIRTSQDKTLFSCDQDDMDITQSHTVGIENKILGDVTKIQHSHEKEALRSGLKVSSGHINKTVFNVLVDDVAFTRSHTMVIDGKNMLAELKKQSHSQVSINTSTSQSACGQADMDITRSCTVPIHNVSESTAHRISNPRKSSITNKSVQQINAMQVNTKGIEDETLSDKSGKLSLAKTLHDKTVVFLCDQDEMDITKSHTIVIEDARKPSLQTSKIQTNRTVPSDQTFACASDNIMEITKSHTTIIRRGKGLPIKQEVSFMPSAYADKTAVFTCDDSMDFTKSQTTRIDSKMVEAPKHLEMLKPFSNINSGIMLGLSMPTVTKDNTVKFSADDGDLEMTKCPTVAIESGSTIGERQDNYVAATNKTFPGEQADMDMTEAHSILIDADNMERAKCQDVKHERKSMSLCMKDRPFLFSLDSDDMDVTRNDVKTALSAPRSNVAFTDKTVKFTSNLDDMDLTKSQTVAIDNKMIAENKEIMPDIGKNVRESIATFRKTSLNKTVNFSENVGNMVFTQIHTVSIEGTTAVSPTKRGLPVIAGTSVFSDAQDDMDITKSCTVAIDSDPLRETKDLETFGTKSSIRKSLGNLLYSSNDAQGLLSGGKVDCAGNGLNSVHGVSVNKFVNCEKIGATDHYASKETTSELSRNVDMDITDNHSVAMESACESSQINKTHSKENSEFSVPSLAPSNTCPEYREQEVEIDPVSRITAQKECLGHVSKEDESNFPQNNTGVLEDNQTAKNPRLKSKRVSFMVPDSDVGSCMFMVDISEVVILPSAILDEADIGQGYSPVPAQHLEDCQREQEGLAEEPVAPETVDLKYGLTSQPSASCKPEVSNFGKLLEKEEHNTAANCLFKNTSMTEGITAATTVLTNTVGEHLQKDKCRRMSISDIHLRIKNLTHKSKPFPGCQTAPVTYLVEQVPASAQASDPLRACVQTDQIAGEDESSCKVPIVEKQDNEESDAEDAVSTTKVEAAPKATYIPKRLPIKIFQPKLPNKRHSNVRVAEEPPSSSVPEASLQTDRTSVTLLRACTLGGGAAFIDAEMLPTCPDESELHGSISYEVPEGAWEALCEKEALHHSLEKRGCESDESRNSQKRARDMEGNGELQREKRVRLNNPTFDTDAAKTPGASESREDLSVHATKTIEQTNCSNSSSLDSRGDGTSIELSSQQYSQIGSRLLLDSGCEQSLWEKLQDGTITVKEFFMLLKVRILIQRPRHSELPANHRVNNAPTQEDLMVDQYIYQPKLQVYEEDCQALYQTVQELKTCVEMQDKPLMHVNNLIWEAMRTCSEEELLCFGVELRRQKTLYTKKSKVLSHNGKVSLYSKLLHTAQVQCEQLVSRINEVDKFLEEADHCISELEMETAKLDTKCRSASVAEWDPRVKELQIKAEHLKSEEECSDREHAQLENKKEQILTQLGCLQEEERRLGKRMEEFTFTEWELDEWTDDHAVFTFLYDSIELAITFGDPVDGENFIDKPCRRISSVTFESQLNEEMAPPSSILVQRLILQFIENRGCLHHSYTTQEHLPQLLLDVSLVVSRCRLLGEEVEFLMKWGAKFYLLKTEVHNTEVKFLFSSSAAFAKFELVINVSESYPTVPMSFSVVKRIGRIGHDEISAVLSEVPVGLCYLKRAVRHIYQKLLL